MTLREAVANLIKVKGRHNTEIAYQKLIEAFDADKPEQDYRDVVIAGDLWRIEFLPNNDANVRLVKAGYTTKQEEVEQAMLEVWQDVGDPRFPHIAQPEQLITPGGGLPNDHNGVTAAQPEPEPVAWWHDMGDVVDLNVSGRGTPLYFAPPQREFIGLTDEEIREFEIWLDNDEEEHGWNPPENIVKYLEAKLREKNHG